MVLTYTNPQWCEEQVYECHDQNMHLLNIGQLYTRINKPHTFCLVFSNLDFSFLPRLPVQPVTNSEPVEKVKAAKVKWQAADKTYISTNTYIFPKIYLEMFLQ